MYIYDKNILGKQNIFPLISFIESILFCNFSILHQSVKAVGGTVGKKRSLKRISGRDKELPFLWVIFCLFWLDYTLYSNTPMHITLKKEPQLEPMWTSICSAVPFSILPGLKQQTPRWKVFKNHSRSTFTLTGEKQSLQWTIRELRMLDFKSNMFRQRANKLKR